jgi:hypothetical protein
VFATEDEALDFAAEKEDERLGRMKHDLVLLIRYSDEDHPADPVLPRPGDLLLRLAEIHNADHPGDLVELPDSEDDTDDEDVLRERTLAILDQVRAGAGYLDLVDGLPAPPEDDEDDSSDPEAPDTGGGTVEGEDGPESGDGPPVVFDFDHDPESGRLRTTMTSQSADTLVIDREVTAADGEALRAGTAELPPGRVLTRHYDLAPGQTVVFSRQVGGVAVELSRFTAENSTDGDPVE